MTAQDKGKTKAPVPRDGRPAEASGAQNARHRTNINGWRKTKGAACDSKSVNC